MGMGLGGGGSSKRQRRVPMSEINVTPMVDVMLVLLIIFMVTAPLLVTGVPVNLPDSKAGAIDQDMTPIQIALDDKGRIYIDKEIVTDENFSTRIGDIAAERADTSLVPVYVRADTNLGYGRVMRILGDTTAVGFKKVALISDSAITDERK